LSIILAHRFDLLGSGWVEVKRAGFKEQGLSNVVPQAALSESERIWKCIDASYSPIDWQLDFKSGHRWSEQEWYQAVRVAPVAGADIKVPWELARCQHLPQMALVALSR
jgi:hypothetical protein